MREFHAAPDAPRNLPPPPPVRTFMRSYDFRLARLSGAGRILICRFSLNYLDGNLRLE